MDSPTKKSKLCLENEAVETHDIHNLVEREVNNKIRPILIMVASEGEQTRCQFKKLEDLVLRRRLFRRRLFLNAAMFILAVVLLSCL